MGALEMDIEDAFQFFGLDRSATEEIFNRRFHELAFKYHPDRGEFNSNIIFLELMKHRQTLGNFFENRNNHIEAFKKLADDFTLYKQAKQLENDAIIKYFKSREKFNNQTAPNADFEIQLREELKTAKTKYLELIREYQNSVWIRDAKDSIQSIDVWLK